MTSIFYNIGPSCLSTDKMFQALEYKDLLSMYNKSVAAHKTLVGRKEIELKAKALLSKEKPTVKDYQDMLRWKLGDDYSKRTKGFKLAQLKELWETVKDPTTLDIFVPEEPVEPAVPGTNNTQLGRTIKQRRGNGCWKRS